MNYDKQIIDSAYHNILNGFTPFIYNDNVFFAKHVSSEDMFMANSFILKSKDLMLKNGILSEYDILKDCCNRGIWSKNKDVEVIQIQKQISKKSETLHLLIMPSQIKQVNLEISELNKKLAEIEKEKSLLTKNSLECKILEDKRDYMCFLCLYNSDLKRVWQSYDDFLNEDSNFINELIVKFYNAISSIDTSLIRAIVRTTDVRFKLKIFSTENIKSVSTLFLELKQWSDFYNSIYELPDRPSDDIIQDDSKLDSWLIGRRSKSTESKSVNNKEGFVGYVGATKEDMEIMNGLGAESVLKVAKAEHAK